MEKKKVLNILWDYLVLSFGTLVYCLAWTSVLLPNTIPSGGLTGACAILQYGTGIPMSYSFFVINTILIILGTIIMGKGFGFRTVYAYLLSSLFLYLIPKYLPGFVIHLDEKMFAALLGGFIEAFGISFVLNKGGSTGGTDVIAVCINKFWPISLGKVYLCTDLLIIFTVVFIDGMGVTDVLYGYLAMIAFSFGVDYFTLGPKSTVQVLIFSKKYKEIADRLITMDRGVTALNSVGWYSGEESKVLLVIVRKSNYQAVVNLVKELDDKAFVSVSNAASVFGEGFEEIKSGVSKKKKNVPKACDGAKAIENNAETVGNEKITQGESK